MGIFKSVVQYSLLLCHILVFPQASTETVDAFDDNGKTALLNAITTNKYDVAKALIGDGANINLSENSGLKGSPLMYAAANNQIAICSLLIENGVDINQLDNNGDHALNWAAFHGNASTMKLLIKNGADINLRSIHGTASDVALRLWHTDSVLQVFRNTNIKKILGRKEKKFLDAITLDDPKEVSKLLEKGMSPDLLDEIGVPVLQLAAQKGYYEITKMLLKHGADVNILNSVGQTPLAWACRFGQIATAHLLLKSGADPNRTGKEFGLTPLIAAAVNGNSAVAQLLIAENADMDAQDRINNAGALHWAMFYKNLDFAKTMIHNGADYERKILDGSLSAHDIAVSNNYQELQLLLNKRKKKENNLSGSWSLKEVRYQYADTTYVAKLENMGRFIFDDRNYTLVYNVATQPRTPFNNLSNPKEEEIVKAFKSIVFNSGSYEHQKNQIATTSDIAKVPGFEKGQQYYNFKFDTNDNLRLIMYDEIYPNGERPKWVGHLKIVFMLVKED